MEKRFRQYVGLFIAIILYYVVHEGAHFICALFMGVFKQINFMGLGIQIDVYNTAMTDVQMGIFCIAGATATLFVGIVLILLCDKTCKVQSKMFKAIMYYVTIAMLLIDPLYLSVLCGFFGGGDMNGISLLLNEVIARTGFGILLLVNVIVFLKVILPRYTRSFQH